jgi:hypothetical protein
MKAQETQPDETRAIKKEGMVMIMFSVFSISLMWNYKWEAANTDTVAIAATLTITYHHG